jgi:hypothetical protein
MGLLCTHPLYPPLKQLNVRRSVFSLFERGREYERGLRPLSPVLPSPANMNIGLINVTGWRGAEVRLK